MKPTPAVLSALLALTLAACSSAPRTKAAPLEPSPRYSPAEVMRILLSALKDNDAEDRGIETVFRFASPENRSATGPLERFAAMIRSPLYEPMLNHVSAVYDDMEVAGELARQQVAVSTRGGWAVVYSFLLRRQPSGSCAGCWMAERVTLVDIVRLPRGRPA